MSLFSNDNLENQQELFFSRMLSLQQAIANGDFNLTDLQKIAASHKDADAGLLHILLQNNKNKKLHIPDALTQALKHFEDDNEYYLPLSPLAKERLSTENVADFARFYELFIQYLSVKKSKQEDGDAEIDFNLLKAKAHWIDWRAHRQADIHIEPSKRNQIALFEKFLLGQVKKEEWLTEIDVQRALTMFDLASKGVHIVPLNAEDIGLVLSHERNKHALDKPKKPYVISLMVNLGEDGYSRINSRGVHWTSMVLKVDPTKAPPQISVDYKDSLFLSTTEQNKIKEIIEKALKYRVQIGNFADAAHLEIYEAFPQAKADINIEGAEGLRNAYLSGYAALQNIIQQYPNELQIDAKKLIEATNPSELRDALYSILLSYQSLSLADKETLQKNGVDDFLDKDRESIKENLIEGLLFSLSSSRLIQIVGIRANQSLTAANLAKLAEVYGQAKLFTDSNLIRQFQQQTNHEIELDLDKIFKEFDVKEEKDKKIAITVLFETIRNNKTIENIKLINIADIEPTFFYQELDTLPLGINLTSNNLELQAYLKIINARNRLLAIEEVPIKPGLNPWEALFKARLFRENSAAANTVQWINIDDSQASDEVAVISFKKFLDYIAENEKLFDNEFSNTLFSTSSGNKTNYNPLEILRILREHIKSDTPFIPFKQIVIGINNVQGIQNALYKEIEAILATTKDKPLDKIGFEFNSFDNLDEKVIDDLISLIKEKGYSTLISFKAQVNDSNQNLSLNQKLSELENIALQNKRAKIKEASPPQPKKRNEISPDMLGKIGKALWGNSLGSLNVDIQVQEQQQQQQQVQQQVQTAISDDMLEETTIEVEEFVPYMGEDELLDKKAFIAHPKIEELRLNQHSHISAEQCWQLITGVNSEHFKYGIKKIGLLAAIKIIENLKDFQYGVHPDNLPKGFSITQDENGNVALIYERFDPPINPNESPLTIRFSQPLAANQWAGNILQFISLNKAKSLYDTLYGREKGAKPSLEQCIKHFFFFRDNVDEYLCKEQDDLVLDAIIEESYGGKAALIKAQIKNLLGVKLGDKDDKLIKRNLVALTEILYQKGPEALSEFLDLLEKLKNIKGEKFFTRFKSCFLDVSDNFNELISEDSKKAIEKLTTLSLAETNWWLSLSEEHVSNLKYNNSLSETNWWLSLSEDHVSYLKYNNSLKRWSNLSHMVEGFTYFCDNLRKLHPSLNLPLNCPLKGVADMRVGLDRLLSTILPNSLNIVEQFYALSPDGLDLDALGPFYASRYEGFKYVSNKMRLKLDSDDIKPGQSKEAKLAKSKLKTCFKVDKDSIGDSFYDAVNKREILLRYIATFNHRASEQQYNEAFDLLSSIVSDYDHHLTPYRWDNVLIIIAIFGTGKRGKNFTKEDIQKLGELFFPVNEDNQPENNDLQNTIQHITSIWRELRYSPIRPTLKEIILITDYVIKNSNEPKIAIDDINRLMEKFKQEEKAATSYIETLLLLVENKQAMSIDVFQKVLLNLEGYAGYISAKEATASFFPDDSILRTSVIKLIALCRNEGLTEDKVFDEEGDDIDPTSTKTYPKIRALFEAVEACVTKQGQLTTNNLLELLGNIDVNSQKLPSIDEMISIIQAVTKAEIRDYKSLDLKVKQSLPEGCQIEMSKVKAGGAPEQGNLLGILNSQMTSIIEKLKPLSKYIPFYDELSTPEGASHLLKGLDSLDASIKNFKEENPLVPQFVIDKGMATVFKTMGHIYDKIVSDGLAVFSTEKDQLARVINGFQHRVKGKIASFAELKRVLAADTTAVEKITQALSDIHKNLPKEFSLLINWLDTNKELKLESYSLSLVSQVFESFASFAIPDSMQKQPFPMQLLQSFLSLSLTKESENIIIDGLKTIFDVELSLPKEEKIRLCQIALRSFKEDSAQTLTLINDLIARRNEADFGIKLVFLQSVSNGLSLTSFERINEAFRKISELDKALANAIIQQFSQSDNFRPKFIAFSDKITSLPSERKAAIVTIIFKAMQKENAYSDELFNSLSKLPDDALEKLRKLYQGLNYPNATDLKGILAENIDFERLENQYDKDPNARRESYQDEQLETRPKSRKPGELKSISEMTYNELQDLIGYYNKVIATQEIVLDEATKKQNEKGFDQNIIEEAKNKIEQAKKTLRQLTLASQFNTSKLAAYLNNTKDLNYNRTLLLSQRQQLQKWFLFINVIGKDRPIPVKPWEANSEEAKAIKDMSYTELQGLLAHYRAILQDPELADDTKIRTKLETIAVLREVMFRTTDRFPRPTQILCLLLAIQNGKNYVAQIKTGQGKSLTAALAAALENIEGKTVDACTANEALAEEGFRENEGFFNYLGIKAKTIHVDSSMDAYEKGAIHYSSMSDLALYRSKNSLLGKKFPEDTALIADEFDFSTLDDNTRYRYATSLDPVTDPKRSPYVWIYEALIEFADTQKEKKLLLDEDLKKEAKKWLKLVNKDPEQLKALEANKKFYDQRLTDWLVAAAKTAKLINLEEYKFRIVQLKDARLGENSKACILTGGSPKIQAEFSDAVQQFLHLRLIKKYKTELDEGKMHPFYVEPEKTYITTLNSKIFIERYKTRWGMTGTAGSKEEIKEQYAKYGFHFVDIPSFEPSNRQDLAPILSSASLVDNPEEEKKRIDKIVKKILAHIKQSSRDGSKCDPIFIECINKSHGEKIALALNKALSSSSTLKDNYSKVQEFYSASQSAIEEGEYKKNAGLQGYITIFDPSNKQDLAPTFKSAKSALLIDNLDEEEKNHIDKIVKEVLEHIKKSPKGQDGKCSPILIQCGDKKYGKKIGDALAIALMDSSLKENYDSVQEFYSSEHADANDRTKEERQVKKNAGKNGVITISTVFDRGTDIKPTHAQGLYTIQTYVDTKPYSAEDLQRAKEQKIGRSGRAGQVGFSRLIIRRSEFKDAYLGDPKKLKSIPQTIEGLDKAIEDLNAIRNKKRKYEREMRESFDDIKEAVSKKFFPFIDKINESTTLPDTKKKAIREQLFTQWSLLLKEIDNRWDELEETDKLKEIAQYVATQWRETLDKKEGIIETWEAFAKENNLDDFRMPAYSDLDAQELINNIKAIPASFSSYYIKKEQINGEVDENLTADEVYADFMADNKATTILEAKKGSIAYHIERMKVLLNSEAHRAKLANHIKAGKAEFDFNVSATKLAKNIMSALLYLRYHAYRDGNAQSYAHLSQECRRFMDKMSRLPEYQEAVIEAQQRHYDILVEKRGQFEDKKAFYLKNIMSEWQQIAPEKTSEWKSANRNGFVSLFIKQIKTSLSAYRDNWWERDWVSGDRKEVVKTLLNELEKQDRTVTNILLAITEARRTLLANDQEKKRPLTSSIGGRLFNYLNELELKIQTAMLPEELDNNIANEFANIALVLDAAKKLNPPPIKDLNKMVDILNDKGKENSSKYHALASFFKSITMMSSFDERFRNEDWVAFRDYCRQKQNHLVYYFSQSSDTLKSLNDKRSVQVYRAATQALIDMAAKVVKEKGVKLDLPKDYIEYREQRVNFTDQAGFSEKEQKNAFFRRVNREKGYIELLGNLEKYIVEHAHTDTKVDFNQIQLLKGKYFGSDPSFDLKIILKINGQDSEVLYHFNMKTGSLFMDNESLKKLDEAVVDDKQVADELNKRMDGHSEDIRRLALATKDVLELATQEIDEFKSQVSSDFGINHP